MNEQFAKELLHQVRKDKVVISFKHYLSGSSFAYEMWVFLKNSKKKYIFKMTEEEHDRMKFLIDIIEQERVEE